MIDLEFRHKVTGCGTHLIIEISRKDIKRLKECLASPGIDIEVLALEYPYKTAKGGK